MRCCCDEQVKAGEEKGLDEQMEFNQWSCVTVVVCFVVQEILMCTTKIAYALGRLHAGSTRLSSNLVFVSRIYLFSHKQHLLKKRKKNF